MFQPRPPQKQGTPQSSQPRNSSVPVQDNGALQLRAGLLQLQQQYGNQRTMQMLKSYRFTQQRPLQMTKKATASTSSDPRPPAMYRVRKKGAVRIKLAKIDAEKPFNEANTRISQVVIGQERPRGIFGDHHGSHTTAWEVFCDVVRFSINQKTVTEAISIMKTLCSSDLENLPGLPSLPHINGEGMEEEEEKEESPEESQVESGALTESLPGETVTVEAEELQSSPSASSGQNEEEEQEEQEEDQGKEQWTYNDLDTEYEPEYLTEEDDKFLLKQYPEPIEEEDQEFEEQEEAEDLEQESSTLLRSGNKRARESEPIDSNKSMKTVNIAESEPGPSNDLAEERHMMSNYLKAYRRLGSSITKADTALTSEDSTGLENIGLLQELVLSFLQFRNSLPLSAFNSAVNNGKSEGKLLKDIRYYENFQGAASEITPKIIAELRTKMWLLLDQAAVEEFYEANDNAEAAKMQVGQIVKRHLMTLKQAYSNVFALTKISSPASIKQFLSGRVKPLIKNENDEPVTLHFDEETAGEIAKLVMSPQLKAGEFKKRDVVTVDTKKFACQIELSGEEESVITHIRFSGRAPGIFGSATMGSHLTAWSLHTEVIKTKLRGKTLTVAREELDGLYEDSKNEGGYKRVQKLRDNVVTAAKDDTSEQFPGVFHQETDGEYTAIFERFKKAEDDIKDATAAADSAEGATLLPALQDYIGAYMHFRNTLPLSAVDGRNSGIRATGRGEPALIRDVRKVERLSKENEALDLKLAAELEEMMLTEEEITKKKEAMKREQHLMPDKKEVRRKMWEMLDHDALNYFTRYKATPKTAPGIKSGETHLDLINDVINTHLKALREAYPKAYAYAEMGTGESRDEFLAKLAVTNKEGENEDILKALKEVSIGIKQVTDKLGANSGSEVHRLCETYMLHELKFTAFLASKDHYDEVVSEVKKLTTTDDPAAVELKEYNVEEIELDLYEVKMKAQDKVQEKMNAGKLKRLGIDKYDYITLKVLPLLKLSKLNKKLVEKRPAKGREKKAINYHDMLN